MILKATVFMLPRAPKNDSHDRESADNALLLAQRSPFGITPDYIGTIKPTEAHNFYIKLVNPRRSSPPSQRKHGARLACRREDCAPCMTMRRSSSRRGF